MNRNENAEGPELLDIVKIDGRWAQVMAGGEIIKYLDSTKAEEINWNDYQLSKRYEVSSVRSVIDSGIGSFTPEEINNIHWGGEERGYPHLPRAVLR